MCIRDRRQAQLNYDELLSGMSPSASAAGVVQQVHVQKGDLVSPGTPIADVADNSTMTLTLPFQSADASSLSPGQEMCIRDRLKGISSFTSSRCSAKHSFLVFHSSAKSFCFPAFFLPRLQKS